MFLLIFDKYIIHYELLWNERQGDLARTLKKGEAETPGKKSHPGKPGGDGWCEPYNYWQLGKGPGGDPPDLCSDPALSGQP